MSRFLFLSFVCLGGLFFSFHWIKNDYTAHPIHTVEDILLAAGDEPYIHHIEGIDSTKLAYGRSLVFNGVAKNKQHRSKRISKFFVCTDCHNTTKEFDDLSDNAPENRLKYAQENGIPFLPGSTFYGIYNRKKFYNGDYIKKYGDLVNSARDTLANAIQVCAKYCSSGRYLNDYEVESIIHYYKSIQYTLHDLGYSEKATQAMRQQIATDHQTKQIISEINSKFLDAYPATFLGALDTDKRKFGEGGNAKNGEAIFEKSCMFCHYDRRVTNLNLDKDKLTASKFINNLSNYSNYSLYQIIRWGTYPIVGRKQYMPLYTKEKMSDQQIEDLVAYFKSIENE